MKQHIFVSIDGVDGVGKTVVAKLLAADGFFHYHKSPSGPFEELRKEIDAHATPIERYCFYRLAIANDSEEIRRLLQTTSVISDRYLTTTVAYHVAMDQRVLALHNDHGILKPHFAFLLEARPDIRDQRIKNRALVTSDRNLEQNSAFLDKVANVFKGFGLITIDTSDISPEQCAEIIKDILKKGNASCPSSHFRSIKS